MQAVILVAGRGTRMGALTEGTPKAMLEVADHPILEHKLRALPKEIDEVILVVGYLGGIIQKYFGGEFDGKRILYVEQEEQKGTADALWAAKDILKGKFIVMNGDDIYSPHDTERAMEAEWGMLVYKTEKPIVGGRVVVNKKNEIIDIVEDSSHEKSGLLNMGVYILDDRIFKYQMVPKSPGSPELGLPQTILAASKKSGIPFKAVEGKFWVRITAPEDLEKATKILAKS